MSDKKEKKIETANAVEIKAQPNKLSPHRRRVLLHCGKGLTEQAHKDDCDINQIVAKYSRNELKELLVDRPAFYADLSSAPDFLESMNIVVRAQEQFDALPSSVRKEFDNDPAKFLAFAEDSKNAEKMVSLGLAQKRPINDPPASRSDIEKLTKVVSHPKGKSQPAGGPKGEDDPS